MNWASACFVIVVTVFACIVCTVEGRVCTRVRGEKGMKTVQYPDQCQQSYKARCGWFSTKMCTFNETIPCLKARNMTMTIYRVVEDCCPGYYKNKDGRCAPTSEPGGGYGPGSGHDNDEDDDNFFFGISHGAYAGIICGILFVACVALLTALHYRKRRLQQEKKNSHNAEQDVGQMQHLIHMDKIESPTSPTGPASPTPPVTT